MSATPDALAAEATKRVASAQSLGAGSAISAVASFMTRHSGVLVSQSCIIMVSTVIIYLSAHASLRRPSSAAPTEDEADGEADKGTAKKKARRPQLVDLLDLSEGEGITTKEAIMMPIGGCVTLCTLYFLLKYLNDPAIINRLLRFYISAVSTIGISMLVGDAVDMAFSLVFPNVWADSAATVFRVDPVRQKQLRRVAPEAGSKSAAPAWVVDEKQSSPFPQRLAWLAPNETAVRAAWTARRILREDWTARLAVAGFGDTGLFRMTPGTTAGLITSLALRVAYVVSSSVANATATNNLIGLSMAYVALNFISCESFGVSSLVLGLLFVYDVVMVFYTPIMVTVASKLDAHLMISSGSAGRGGAAALGLGDIVVPGIFMCMCLRYDLYRFYVRKMQKVPTELVTEVAMPASDPATGAAAAMATAITTTTVLREVKAPFVDPQARWGDTFWTRGLCRVPGSSAAAALTPGVQAAAFPKTYFRISIAGYMVGLVVAVIAVTLTGKGQPALFYLVPCIMLPVWAWAWMSGELAMMQTYTENGSADVKDVVVEVGPDGKPIADEEKEVAKESEKKEKDESTKESNEVFVLSLFSPSQEDTVLVDI